MKKIREFLLNWCIKNNDNRFTVILVNRLFPLYFFRWMLKEQGKYNINLDRKVYLSLSFDCDTEEDIKGLPSLSALLAKYSIAACFACIGEYVEKFPYEHKCLVESGHEILNHGYRVHHYRDKQGAIISCGFFDRMNEEQRENEIRQGDKIIQDVLHYKPKGFRTPHFGTFQKEKELDWLYSILKKIGYLYSSSTAMSRTDSGGMFFVKNDIIEFPLTGCPEHPFTVFDSWHLHDAPDCVHEDKDFPILFKLILDSFTKDKAMYLNFYFDPRYAAYNQNFEKVLHLITKEYKHVLIKKYEDIITEFRLIG